jgi:hypothetical protein
MVMARMQKPPFGNRRFRYARMSPVRICPFPVRGLVRRVRSASMGRRSTGISKQAIPYAFSTAGDGGRSSGNAPRGWR